jgi:hypothetical protein
MRAAGPEGLIARSPARSPRALQTPSTLPADMRRVTGSNDEQQFDD